MYESNSAKKLKIIVTGTNNVEEFGNMLNENILTSIKICQNFTLHTHIATDNDISLNDSNFIFYVTTIDNLTDSTLTENIIKMSSSLTDPINHLFIIVNGCDNMEFDDDGDLVFSDDTENDLYQKFDEQLSKSINDKLFHVCRISMSQTNIWNTISNDSSIINLTESQINELAPTLIKKSSKMSLIDKKREIKVALKKINIDDKIAETGYTELFDNVYQYFKLVYQKKIVCQNYLSIFDKINLGLKTAEIDNINNILKEIYEISFLKTEMHDDLIDKIDSILLTKLKNFCDKYKNNIVIEPNQTGAIDAYAYHNFLVIFMDIAKGYNLSNIMEIIKREISIVNNLIIDYHNKEVEKVTDLEKISSLLEIFANKDKNNLIGFFDKIRSHPKIMQENIEKMDKWIYFINKCLKLGIPKDCVIRLMEEIIMAKIQLYTDISKTNSRDLSVIYPQCLNVFLLSNINKHFVFKKLYMFISYSIRYSGRNILDYIKNIRPDQYHNILLLENKLLDLCTVHIEEPSQPINLSDVDIVETFNEDTVQPKKIIKISDNNSDNMTSKSPKNNKKKIINLSEDKKSLKSDKNSSKKNIKKKEN